MFKYYLSGLFVLWCVCKIVMVKYEVYLYKMNFSIISISKIR